MFPPVMLRSAILLTAAVGAHYGAPFVSKLSMSTD